MKVQVNLPHTCANVVTVCSYSASGIRCSQNQSPCTNCMRGVAIRAKPKFPSRHPILSPFRVLASPPPSTHVLQGWEATMHFSATVMQQRIAGLFSTSAPHSMIQHPGRQLNSVNASTRALIWSTTLARRGPINTYLRHSPQPRAPLATCRADPTGLVATVK